jgi:hypothetical protein
MRSLVINSQNPLLMIGNTGVAGGAITHASKSFPSLLVNVNASTASQTSPEATQAQANQGLVGKQRAASQ